MNLSSEAIAAVQRYVRDRIERRIVGYIHPDEVARATGTKQDVARIILDGFAREGALTRFRYLRDVAYSVKNRDRFVPVTEEEALRRSLEAYERRTHSGITYPEILTELSYTEALG